MRVPSMLFSEEKCRPFIGQLLASEINPIRHNGFAAPHVEEVHLAAGELAERVDASSTSAMCSGRSSSESPSTVSSAASSTRRKTRSSSVVITRSAPAAGWPRRQIRETEFHGAVRLCDTDEVAEHFHTL